MSKEDSKEDLKMLQAENIKLREANTSLLRENCSIRETNTQLNNLYSRRSRRNPEPDQKQKSFDDRLSFLEEQSLKLRVPAESITLNLVTMVAGIIWVVAARHPNSYSSEVRNEIGILALLCAITITCILFRNHHNIWRNMEARFNLISQERPESLEEYKKHKREYEAITVVYIAIGGMIPGLFVSIIAGLLELRWLTYLALPLVLIFSAYGWRAVNLKSKK